MRYECAAASRQACTLPTQLFAEALAAHGAAAEWHATDATEVAECHQRVSEVVP